MAKYLVSAILVKEGRDVKQVFIREDFDRIDDENAAVYAFFRVKQAVMRRRGFRPGSIILIRKEGSKNILVCSSWTALAFALADLADAKEEIRRLRAKTR